MMHGQRVGPLADLAENEGRRVEVDGCPVAVFRRGDRVFALADACPHMGASLSEGFVNGDAVVCPWHGWTFDLETGISPFDDEERVRRFSAVVVDGEVYVRTSDADREGDSEGGPAPAGEGPAGDG